MTILGVIALILLIIAIVVGAMGGEYRTGSFWFLTVIGVAAVAHVGGFNWLGGLA